MPYLFHKEQPNWNEKRKGTTESQVSAEMESWKMPFISENGKIRITLGTDFQNNTYANDSLLSARKTVKDAKNPVLSPIV